MSSIVTTQLDAKVRTGSGKGYARRARAEGLIPAIVYGRHLEKPISISVNPKALREAVQGKKRLNTVIGLKIEGGKEHMVLVKDYQMHPVSRELLHADFIDLKENEQVKVKVPLNLVGKSEGQAAGGILTLMRRELELWALPAAIPEKIDIDVTPLKIAQALHANEVKLPAGVTVKTTVNYTIVVVTAPEAEVVATPVVAVAVPGAPVLGPDGKPLPAGAAPAADGKAAPGGKPGDAKAAAPAAGGKADAKPAKK